MPPQNNEVVPEYVAPTKLQWVLCTTYPVPLPSPDSYNSNDGEENDDDSDLSFHNIGVKWYDRDEDSYCSRCPKDKKFSCKRPPTIWSERKFLCFFEGKQKGVPYWAKLKIQVDLQEEYNILVWARRTANLRRKAKEGQNCFVEWDFNSRDELEYLTWQWQTKAHAKKEKSLVPLKESALSQKDLDIITVNKKALSDNCRRIHWLVWPPTSNITK